MVAAAPLSSDGRNYPRGWNMTASDAFFNKHIVPNPQMRQFMKYASRSS